MDAWFHLTPIFDLFHYILDTLCHTFVGQRGFLVTPHGFPMLRSRVYAARAIVQ